MVKAVRLQVWPLVIVVEGEMIRFVPEVPTVRPDKMMVPPDSLIRASAAVPVSLAATDFGIPENRMDRRA
jgi:hypothetical protein